MTPTKTVRLNAIKKMLAKCAPGWTIRLATHSRVIQFKGKTYHLPKDDPMPSFQVRKLASQRWPPGILAGRDCLARGRPALGSSAPGMAVR